MVGCLHGLCLEPSHQPLTLSGLCKAYQQFCGVPDSLTSTTVTSAANRHTNYPYMACVVDCIKVCRNMTDTLTHMIPKPVLVAFYNLCLLLQHQATQERCCAKAGAISKNTHELQDNE